MRVDLDAKVRTHDGEDAGSVQRAVVDPRTKEVTHFVISTGALFGRDVLVPREELEAATRDGEVLRLRLSKSELEKLPDFVPANYVAPPVGWMGPAGYGFPYTGYLWPVGIGYPPAPVETPADTRAGTPGAGAVEDEVSLNKGAVVFDRDGDDIGVVEDVLFEPASGRLTGFVLRIGGALRTLFGGGDRIEVSRRLVERVEEGAVYLRADKEEIK